MIYLTGDTHGYFSRIEMFCREKNTSQEDILIILGDAGINIDLGRRDQRVKEYTDQLPITLFCIHGNHEQRPYVILTYEEKKWHGGNVYYEKEHPNVLFAKDGEIYDFGGKKAIAIGGAYSVDKFIRIVRGMPWFDNEQPSEEIKRRVEEQLEKNGWKIDYVLSHTAPLKYEPTEVFLPSINQSTVDKSTEIWLGELEDKLEYKKWYCGHYHTAKRIDKIQLMYEDFDELEI